MFFIKKIYDRSVRRDCKRIGLIAKIGYRRMKRPQRVAIFRNHS